MKLTSIEKETIINFNEAERTASIYTHNEALKRQLLELCQTHPEQVCQTAANGWGGLTFELPKKWLKVSPPRKPIDFQFEEEESPEEIYIGRSSLSKKTSREDRKSVV